MSSERALQLLLERLEAAARQFPNCWHFLVKANHSDWPDIPDPDDPDCVLSACLRALLTASQRLPSA